MITKIRAIDFPKIKCSNRKYRPLAIIFSNRDEQCTLIRRRVSKNVELTSKIYRSVRHKNYFLLSDFKGLIDQSVCSAMI